MTEGQCDKAVQQLIERYYDKEQIIHNHYALLSSVSKCANVTQDLSQIFNFLEAQVRSLETFGENTENNYIISLVKTKLPDEFNQKLEGNCPLTKLCKNICKQIVARDKSENVFEIAKSAVKDDFAQIRNNDAEYTVEELFSRETKIKC